MKKGMSKSVRLELSKIEYRFLSKDKAEAVAVNDAAVAMNIGVKYESGICIETVTLLFDPGDMNTPILQHNVKTFLSRYDYARVKPVAPWWKRLFTFKKGK